jgi:hypothetical protein
MAMIAESEDKTRSISNTRVNIPSHLSCSNFTVALTVTTSMAQLSQDGTRIPSASECVNHRNFQPFLQKPDDIELEQSPISSRANSLAEDELTSNSSLNPLVQHSRNIEPKRMNAQGCDKNNHSTSTSMLINFSLDSNAQLFIFYSNEIDWIVRSILEPPFAFVQQLDALPYSLPSSSLINIANQPSWDEPISNIKSRPFLSMKPLPELANKSPKLQWKSLQQANVWRKDDNLQGAKNNDEDESFSLEKLREGTEVEVDGIDLRWTPFAFGVL